MTARNDGIKLAERRARALELRVSGKTFREIARELKLASPGNAYREVQAALEEIVREPVREALVLELARLDAVLGAVWHAAMDGDHRSARLVLMCLQRRAAFLGLDCPARSIIAVADERRPEYRDAEEDYKTALAALNEILGPPIEANSNPASND